VRQDRPSERGGEYQSPSADALEKIDAGMDGIGEERREIGEHARPVTSSSPPFPPSRVHAENEQRPERDGANHAVAPSAERKSESDQ